MAKWQPPKDIGSNEHLGRRLFDEPLLAGAADQPSYNGLRLTNFEETRDTEYSLDRIGKSGIDKKVVAYLEPRAVTAARGFKKPKSFNGWAVIAAHELLKAKKAPSLQLVAAPIGGEEPNDNIYHAHALRPEEVNQTFMAYHLRHLFTQYGKIHSVQQPPDWFQRFWNWAKSKLK